MGDAYMFSKLRTEAAKAVSELPGSIPGVSKKLVKAFVAETKRLDTFLVPLVGSQARRVIAVWILFGALNLKPTPVSPSAQSRSKGSARPAASPCASVDEGGTLAFRYQKNVHAFFANRGLTFNGLQPCKRSSSVFLDLAVNPPSVAELVDLKKEFALLRAKKVRSTL